MEVKENCNRESRGRGKGEAVEREERIDENRKKGEGEEEKEEEMEDMGRREGDVEQEEGEKGREGVAEKEIPAS